jgi:hypothetical protein
MADRLSAYWASLRYQIPRQILGRLRYALGWQIYPRFPSLVRLWCEWAARSCRPRRDFRWPAAPARHAAPEPAHWNPAGGSLLALFQLHYFDWAPGSDSLRLSRQVESWIAANPPGSWPSWHPYPTSLRIGNWIRAFGGGMPPPVASSLAAQAVFLESNLEFHLGGNHLLENARALLAAGLFFEGGPASRWKALGLRLLLSEVEEQVLSDGGHCERSPCYHLRMTHLVAECSALLRAAGLLVPEPLAAAEHRMTLFHRALRHQDGRLPLFHDSLQPDPDPQPPAPAPLSFPASGYYILEGPQGRLIADYGAPGASPNPGHQHAGIFSFEISAGPRLVTVDSGTVTYDPGPDRDRLRSTAAHNTVRVDGQDQFQLWGAFRVGRRAWISPVREIREPSFEVVSASHNGYRRLGVGHRRTIVHLPGWGWLIVDDLAGRGSRRVENFLHLAPGLDPVLEEDRVCLRPLGWTILPFGHAAPLDLLADTYAPRLGVLEPSRTLVLRPASELPLRCGYFLGPRPVARLETPAAALLRLEGPAGVLEVQIDPAMFLPVEVRYN